MVSSLKSSSHYLDTLSIKEESLVRALENDLKKKVSGKENQFLIREMDCWQGRADIVWADIRTQGKLSEEQIKVILKLTNAQVLSLLHYQSPRTFQYIKFKTGLMDTTIKKALKELNESKIIKINLNGSYLINNEFKLPKINFNAYEAKLHNWKRALYQAIQYLGFAQYSWVVMPKKHINPALKNLYAFKENGIGLLSIDDRGQVDVYIKPKKHQPSRKAFHLIGISKTLYSSKS
ncbi:hypothetical protein AS180_00270 [Priestia veravalensis]|uniref:Uncharacterized protein n=1 Tax=Priestia veravalensis TaxID=1414648 RepID=A0A0V8JRX3_9BACI|nr:MULTISPECIES: hypothetical protein [Priestia]KSU89839.1 hypothetical protein AS180_00270 [Priestia veravalensis]TYR81085.1 hypothetical protein FZC66_04255 [Priestia megaterium]SCB74662.1 hypothetical protein GA0061087_100158 [Priestia flexa]